MAFDDPAEVPRRGYLGVRDGGKGDAVSVAMPRLALLLSLVLSLLLAFSASAGCIDQGHFAIVADTGTLRGTAWPYSEDLSARSDQFPVGDPVLVAYRPELPWTKIQTGCAAFNERNVFASEEVNLVLRASFTVAHQSRETAVTGSRYQVQLRLGERVVLDEVRRLDGRYPQSERFGAVAANVPRGAHVYSMWFRLLDGPETNQVALGLQWITSQGMPSRYPVASGGVEETQTIGRKWRPVGPALTVETAETSDLILLTSIGATERVVTRYEIGTSGRKDAPGRTMLADSSLFDQRASLPPGRYEIRLWAKALDERATIDRVRTDVAAFPATAPLHEERDAAPLTVTPSGSADEPVTLDPVCGRWTRLLDFQLPERDGDFSWFLHAYLEFPRVVGHGYVEIAIQTVRNQPSRRLGIIEMTDMGITVAQLAAGGDAVSFYGDASAWGNDGGNAMSLWIRIIEGCNDAPFGNELTAGRRWVAVKLLPTTSIHLP